MVGRSKNYSGLPHSEGFVPRSAPLCVAIESMEEGLNESVRWVYNHQEEEVEYLHFDQE